MVQVKGNISLNNDSLITVLDGSFQAASIDPEANFQCNGSASIWTGEYYHLPWPPLTVNGGTENPDILISWSQALELDDSMNVLKIALMK